MFEIVAGQDGGLRLRGRLDAAQVERVTQEFARISGVCVLDFAELDYISSAGLGLLFATHRRVLGSAAASGSSTSSRTSESCSASRGSTRSSRSTE